MLARVHALEQEVHGLRAELDARDHPADDDAGADGVEAAAQLPAPARPGGSSGATIRALVEAREARAQAAARRREAAASQAERRLARRPSRIRVERAGDHPRITIEPMLLRDKLRTQLGWGFAFALVNPGVFFMFGLAAMFWVGAGLPFWGAVAAAVAAWTALLAAANVVWAWLSRPRHVLELTDDDCFALFTRSVKRPLMIGRIGELTVHADEPDPQQLGRVRFESGGRVVAVDRLTAGDLGGLAGALPPGITRE